MNTQTEYFITPISPNEVIKSLEIVVSALRMPELNPGAQIFFSECSQGFRQFTRVKAGENLNIENIEHEHQNFHGLSVNDPGRCLTLLFHEVN